MREKLKTYLSINSVFSLLSGLSMVICGKDLNAFFNISNEYVFPVIGLNLIGFSLFVWYVSRKQLANKMLVNIISGLDGLWVVGSIIIGAFGLFDLSKDGYILMAIVGVWIAFLGYKQMTYNR